MKSGIVIGCMYGIGGIALERLLDDVVAA